VALYVDTVIVGQIETNCYIVVDETTRDAFLIDPGFDAGAITARIERHSYNPRFIINTHGHADHIGCNGAFNLPIYIHERDRGLLSDPVKNLSALFGADIRSPEAERLLRDGDAIPFCASTLQIIHTPGHSPGCVCIKLDNFLFTGDTLFRESIGRTDLPQGDSRQIMRSLREKIMPLEGDYRVFPGHGAHTGLAWEKAHNFYLTNLSNRVS